MLADENVSHGLVAACQKLDPQFPIAHIANWRDGACLQLKDPALLMTLRDEDLILVSFDRSSLAHHAGVFTREGVGHSGVILFRRTVSRIAYGAQARLLMDFWREASDWDWADLVVYLPNS
ncbi:MAG: hypothetical protein M1541_18100 [Acidobacteria bacterium]|nr:hypothetical protein [Acidobacteriota bacterium]